MLSQQSTRRTRALQPAQDGSAAAVPGQPGLAGCSPYRQASAAPATFPQPAAVLPVEPPTTFEVQFQCGLDTG